MRFHDLDLNLLVALDALLAERNTLRAGKKLHLSQSAASSALARLRLHFNDELLMQVGRNMVPTQRALELEPVIRSILMQIENRVLTKAEFVPHTSDRRFRIMASDYVSMVALGRGLAAISHAAPQMSFEIVAMDNSPALTLERGDVDLLIMPDLFTSPDHPRDVYFSDRYVCIVDEKNSEVGSSIPFDQYLALPHAIVRFSNGRQSTFEDWFLERYGQARNIEFITATYAALPYFVAGSRRIATVHKRHAQIVRQILPLRIIPAPVDIPSINEVIQWHRMNDGDDALIWLRQQLIAQGKN